VKDDDGDDDDDDDDDINIAKKALFLHSFLGEIGADREKWSLEVAHPFA